VPWAEVEHVIGETVCTAFTAIVQAKLTGITATVNMTPNGRM
jgi:hypothetical protein